MRKFLRRIRCHPWGWDGSRPSMRMIIQNIHPSIVIRLFRGRVPGAADPAGWARLPLTHNTFQLFLGDPEAFTGQPGDVIQSIQNLTQRKQLVPEKENKSSSKMASDKLIHGWIFISPSLTLLPFQSLCDSKCQRVQLDLMPPVSPCPPFLDHGPRKGKLFWPLWDICIYLQQPNGRNKLFYIITCVRIMYLNESECKEIEPQQGIGENNASVANSIALGSFNKYRDADSKLWSCI